MKKRFEAYGWHVQRVGNGNDLAAVDAALNTAKEEITRPSLICVRTIIGYGAPNKQGTFATHGAPLGQDELLAAKRNLGWPTEPDFLVPDDVLNHFRRALSDGQAKRAEWEATFSQYVQAYPDLAAEFRRRMSGELPAGWDAQLPTFQDTPTGMPTRKASEAVLQALAHKMPELMGGSADLTPSAFSWLKGCGDFQPPRRSSEGLQGAVGGEWGYGGRNVHFGVREHAMGAITAGMAIHGGIIPYAATFFVFSDYMRPPMRLAAMSKVRVIYIFTHDSIGVGEDGPTHQPIEHLMNLRAIPNLTVIRPADAAEAVEAWRMALLNTHGPTALIFTRQTVPVLDRTQCAPAEGLRCGGYILWQSATGMPEVILIGTGSETHVALEAGKKLAGHGINVRVVSLPSWELFDAQPVDYRETVLPPAVKARVAIEAGIKLGWEHYLGFGGKVIGMDRFGASAPYAVLYEKFGITPGHVAQAAKELLGRE